MAAYKVIQNIEAEDKLVGPLTFRQFLYAGLSILNLYLTYLVISKGAPFLAIVFLPIAGLLGFLAWPWSRDQPTEIWLLARLRFLFKPRKRVWSQSGIKKLVTITAPKRIERILTNGLSQNEVRSRLRALADTIDSRGWAIKNVNVNAFGQPALIMNDPSSDRLINPSSLPSPQDVVDVRAADDMLDVHNNPVAQQFDSMINASAKAHRQKLIDKMNQPSPPVSRPKPAQPQPVNDYWFLNQPTQQATAVPQNTVTFNTQVVTPGAPTTDLPVIAATPTADEEAFIKQHKNDPAMSPNTRGHLHVIQPLSAQKQAQPATQMPANGQAQPAPQAVTPGQPLPATNARPQPVTPAPNTAILDLARNDDLNVATIAREAQKRNSSSSDEVVISLH